MSTYEYLSPLIDDQGAVIVLHPGLAEQQQVTLAAGVELELVAVPGGSFRMGSGHGQGYPDEEPQHFVQMASFWIGKYPVTQRQWGAIMGAHRGRFSGPELPVETISWEAAARFCERLSKKIGRRCALPSEAQWEYACRAGSHTPFSYGPTLTSDLANYNGEFSYRGGPKGIYRHVTTPVGSLPPNAFGLFDLHGGLWEWCADAWHDDYYGAPPDGSAWQASPRAPFRVARGGSWHDIPEVCRSAARLKARADEGDEMTGFRIVMNGTALSDIRS
jgi:formylglycine-generating enzyme required for sulfatase activity